MAWFVRGHNRPQPDPVYNCNAEETDSRIWVHVTQSTHSKFLILSPDTDVYHVGLPLQCVTLKEVTVQVSPMHCRELKLLNLTALVNGFENDPDLAQIEPNILPKVVQTLYVVTGCDYISFFSKMGKATFLRYFYQYASFISSGQHYPGTLADTSLQHGVYEEGYLAFLHLIGTVYLKKHSTGFDTPSPIGHFEAFSQPNLSIQQQHYAWLDDIRQNVWYRVKFENEMLPSNEALFLHWKRACWVLHMWGQAHRNRMILEPMTTYGWDIQDGNLSIVWDSKENLDAVQQRVSALLKGCKGATGCTTRRCSCRKNKRECSVGCDCTNCSNTALLQEQITESEVTGVAIDEEIRGMDEEVDDIVDWVFGEQFGTENDSECEAEEYNTDGDLSD